MHPYSRLTFGILSKYFESVPKGIPSNFWYTFDMKVYQKLDGNIYAYCEMTWYTFDMKVYQKLDGYVYKYAICIHIPV